MVPRIWRTGITSTLCALLPPSSDAILRARANTIQWQAGDMWECPDFFPLGQKHVLMVSTQGRVHYFVGTYSDRKFQAETHDLIDGSELHYASKSFEDDRGRRILWGWVREARSGGGSEFGGLVRGNILAARPVDRSGRRAAHGPASGISPLARTPSSNRGCGSCRLPSGAAHSREFAGNPVGNGSW